MAEPFCISGAHGSTKANPEAERGCLEPLLKVLRGALVPLQRTSTSPSVAATFPMLTDKRKLTQKLYRKIKLHN